MYFLPLNYPKSNVNFYLLRTLGEILLPISSNLKSPTITTDTLKMNETELLLSNRKISGYYITCFP